MSDVKTPFKTKEGTRRRTDRQTARHQTEALRYTAMDAANAKINIDIRRVAGGDSHLFGWRRTARRRTLCGRQ